MKTKTPKQSPSTEITEVSFEIVPPEVATAITPIEKQSIEVGFFDQFRKAKEWAEECRDITDPKEAKTARLKGRDIRLEGDKIHKGLKEHSLLMGRAIDGAKNILIAMVKPVEDHLTSIEKAEEIRFAAEQAALRTARLAALAPYMGEDEPEIIHLEMLSERQFQNTLSDRKLLFETKQKRAAEEALALAEKEAAEKKQREEMELENARLRKRQAEHQAEIARVQQEAEEKARKQREAQQELQRAETERLRGEAIINWEKAEAERVQKEKIIAEQRAADEAKLQQELKAEQEKLKAAAAPDRAKLMIYAEAIRAIPLNLTSHKGAAVEKEIKEYMQKFATWVEGRSVKL